MRIEIEEKFQKRFDKDIINRAILVTLAYVEEPANVDLTVLIVGNDKIQALNHQYRDVNAPTDVLAFSMGEIDPDTGKRYLGDVLVSYPKAKHQAQARGHAVTAELQLLTIHGVLHLLGYDHAAEDEKEMMWNLKSEILAKLGLDIKITTDV